MTGKPYPFTPGPKHTLSRDLEPPSQKACKTCGIVFPNSLRYFVPKGQGPKRNPVLTPSSLCKECKIEMGRKAIRKRFPKDTDEG